VEKCLKKLKIKCKKRKLFINKRLKKCKKAALKKSKACNQYFNKKGTKALNNCLKTAHKKTSSFCKKANNHQKCFYNKYLARKKSCDKKLKNYKNKKRFYCLKNKYLKNKKRCEFMANKFSKQKKMCLNNQEGRNYCIRKVSIEDRNKTYKSFKNIMKNMGNNQQKKTKAISR